MLFCGVLYPFAMVFVILIVNDIINCTNLMQKSKKQKKNVIIIRLFGERGSFGE